MCCKGGIPISIDVNILLLCSSPVLTLPKITSAGASGGSFEQLISRIIFWSHCVLNIVDIDTRVEVYEEDSKDLDVQ
ncbi:hypothetical protein CVT25_015160 [Psilocybe cyanescens]|uniref:Uncharacterized protein n=1 Tax=Psilocybe cyanescens TaxID=93625 RepID=A0A409X216_PSICY|nr:hypothetical protein CVT25_015160 [Psilocybe cyanescens]